MTRLAALAGRRRWVVAAAWLALLLAAAPLAGRQTERLTSGGFAVPGSESDVVARSLDRFPGPQRERLAVVLALRPNADAVVAARAARPIPVPARLARRAGVEPAALAPGTRLFLYPPGLALPARARAVPLPPGIDADSVPRGTRLVALPQGVEPVAPPSPARERALREGLRREGAAALRAGVRRVEELAGTLPHLEASFVEARAAERAAARGPVVFVPLTVRGTLDQGAQAAVELQRALGVGGGRPGAVEPFLVGQGGLYAALQQASKESLAAAEWRGFPVVLLVLLAVFGSLTAALLPLLLGFTSVVITGAAIYALSATLEMSVFVTNVASMLGIGVAVDYSLFVLARYREGLQAGLEPERARAVAMATSGTAVTFSGITVAVALGGLFLVDSTAVRSMALGAILVVVVSVLAAVTLLPALISLLGGRLHPSPRRAAAGRRARAVSTWLPGRGRRPGGLPPPRFWEAWTERLMRRPGLSAGLSAALLLLLAAPALGLSWGEAVLGQLPADHEARRGAEIARQAGGQAVADPLQVLAVWRRREAGGPAPGGPAERYAAEIRRRPDVVAVRDPVVARDGSAVLIEVIPRADPESAAALRLVSDLRARAPGTVLGRVADVSVGGATARIGDFTELVAGSMWKVLLFVTVVGYAVLLLLLRSLLLPLKAVLTNLLSVAAACGVLVMVFQWGWLEGLLGIEGIGYLNAVTPPFLLATVFGLSMDYEIFLLTRVREGWRAGEDNRTAVARGLSATAGTISSAALIMVAVFAVFAFTGLRSIQEIGLGLAVAIALDATLVRLILVPATMELLGRWNWWLPRRIERLLPSTERSPRPRRSPVRA